MAVPKTRMGENGAANGNGRVHDANAVLYVMGRNSIRGAGREPDRTIVAVGRIAREDAERLLALSRSIRQGEIGGQAGFQKLMELRRKILPETPHGHLVKEEADAGIQSLAIGKVADLVELQRHGWTLQEA